MKKLINIKRLGLFCFCLALLGLPLSSSFAAQQDGDLGMSEGKRCEKCERGPDGKMVCKPVPCP